MTAPGFRARLRAGDRLVGTLLTLPSPSVAELLAAQGFDWLFVDAEHGAFDHGDVLRVLQAVAGRCACLVRVPGLDPTWIARALDAGATGIIVPQVHAAADATRAVQLAKYPPQGLRGVGAARANVYGTAVRDALAAANDETVVVVQAESRGAVVGIREVAAVPGLDAVFVGPFDLSASLGVPGDVQAPVVQEAIATIAGACREARMPLGIFGMRAEAVLPHAARGFTLLAAGVDTALFAGAAREVITRLRG